MKKLIFILFAIFVASLVFAQDATQELVKKLEKIATALFNVGLAGAVIMLVYAGYLFLGAAGDPKKVEQAKAAVVWSIVGVVVMILARAIKNYIVTSIR